MGGQIERHPHHHTVWTAVFTVFVAVWLGLLFTTKSALGHGAAWIAAAFAVYVVLAFFLPLRLPPIRDERKVAQRRAEHERRLQAVIAALKGVVEESNPGRVDESPRGIAERLIAAGSNVAQRQYESGKPRVEPGTGIGVGEANAWLAEARIAMAQHFTEQLYRVASDLPPDASAADVVAAANHTMPALQNFKTHYKRQA